MKCLGIMKSRPGSTLIIIDSHFFHFSAPFFFFTPDHMCPVIRYQRSTFFNSLDIKVNNSQSLSSLRKN